MLAWMCGRAGPQTPVLPGVDEIASVNDNNTWLKSPVQSRNLLIHLVGTTAASSKPSSVACDGFEVTYLILKSGWIPCSILAYYLVRQTLEACHSVDSAYVLGSRSPYNFIRLCIHICSLLLGVTFVGVIALLRALSLLEVRTHACAFSSDLLSFCLDVLP